MPTCVSEGSHTALFVGAIITSILMLIISAFFYDRSKKVEDKLNTPRQDSQAKNISLAAMILSVMAIAGIFTIYFGFRKRLVGVYAPVPTIPPPVRIIPPAVMPVPQAIPIRYG